MKNTLLKNYLEIEQLRFEDKLNYQLNVDKKIDQEEQLIPSMILQPIVENAVNHGLFHKQGKGKISVDFIYIDELIFQVVVKDDGIGIKKAEELRRDLDHYNKKVEELRNAINRNMTKGKQIKPEAQEKSSSKSQLHFCYY